MQSCINWKNEEVERLRTNFLQGVAIKLIAKDLRRTPGAVNKALSRFRIRTPKILKLKNWPQEKQRKWKRLGAEKDGNTPSSWTSFSTILTWLHHQNIILTVTTNKETREKHYSIGGRPLSKMQVVMYANKRRLEQGEEIFLVEDITW